MIDNCIPVPISPESQEAVLSLNNAFTTELSPLDAQGLRSLLRGAFYARRIGTLDAFMLALDQEHAGYHSPNYLWFRARYPRFVYVDRIVVADLVRGRGYARRLYADLTKHALATGHALIVCEVNSDPPNPASDALHARLGFSEVGSAVIYGGSKTVSYLALKLPTRP